MLSGHTKAPNHIAIIPDGNRRWAKSKGLAPWLGHEMGFKKFRDISSAAFSAGSSYVTFWGASEDNLQKRTDQEVGFLLRYLREELQRDELRSYLSENGVRLRVVGRWNEIRPDEKLFQAVRAIETFSEKFEKKNLTVLFGYDGRSEMTDAVNRLITENRPVKRDDIHAALWTSFLPPVDLVFRTGGEPHWSAGFMMWLTADSQLHFTDRLWPEINKEHLMECFEIFTARERRFGK